MRFLPALALTALAACATTPRGSVSAAPEAVTAAPAVRVWDAARARMVPFAELAVAAASVDVVFFGEQHDDPETHFAEFALLEHIGRVNPNVVLSLEMFERDVQTALDAYLAGRMTEADFLKDARPWDRYATDYRPLVVLARARGWPVIASNVPRPIASAISRRGLAAVLDSLPPASRAHMAREHVCPRDAYYDRFAGAMQGHGGGGRGSAADTAAARAMTERFYEAQCAKDEAMAESIVAAHASATASSYARASGGASAGASARAARPVVVHINGAFHSDYTQGTASRVQRRMPSAGMLVLTAVPVPDPERAAGAEHAPRAAYVIFTRRPGGR